MLRYYAEVSEVSSDFRDATAQTKFGAYMRPRPIKIHKPTLVRSAICTFHNKTMGKRESMISEMMEMIAWDMMILCSCASVKHVPGVCLFHARAIGLHWKIQTKVRMMLLTIRAIMVP